MIHVLFLAFIALCVHASGKFSILVVVFLLHRFRVVQMLDSCLNELFQPIPCGCLKFEPFVSFFLLCSFFNLVAHYLQFNDRWSLVQLQQRNDP